MSLRRSSSYSCKVQHAALEKDIDKITTDSDEYDPTGQIPEQLDAMIAKYRRDVKGQLRLAGWKQYGAVRWIIFIVTSQ